MAAKGKSGKKAQLKFFINCADPLHDEILDLGAFELFLKESIKVDGKKGDLGERIVVTKDKAGLQIVAEEPFSKRYLKYLTKKFLKKNQLKDFMRPVATDHQTYSLKYFKIDDAEED